MPSLGDDKTKEKILYWTSKVFSKFSEQIKEKTSKKNIVGDGIPLKIPYITSLNKVFHITTPQNKLLYAK